MKILQTLGKILIALFSINVLSQVSINVDTSNVILGENARFSINASGNNIIFPVINTIDNYIVSTISSSQATNIINGRKSNSISKIYIFQPTKKTIIPAYNFKIDGKNYQTKPVIINIISPKQNKINDDFILTINSDKKNVYVGEKIQLTATFKRKNTVNVRKVNLNPIKTAGLSLKQIGNIIKIQEKNYIVHKLHYQASVQVSGKIIIGPMVADIGKDNNFSSFFSNIKWYKIYSNKLIINAQELPDNLEIFGNYNIKTFVDKSSTTSNTPINLTIEIIGSGNIEDIEKFNLNIKNTTIYTDEPEIKNNIWTQKVAIIANNNFEILPVTLNYFDKVTKAKKSINSLPISINITGNSSNKNKLDNPNLLTYNNNKILPNSTDNDNNTVLKYWYFLIGLITGVSLLFIIFSIIDYRKKIKHNKNIDIIKLVKKAKTDKVLFDLLLPYNNIDTPRIAKILQSLEANIYKNSKHKINKKDVIKILEIL